MEYTIKIGDYKESPKRIFQITEYKNDSVYKTKEIGISIKSEYSNLPKNINAVFGIVDDLKFEGLTFNVLTCNEIIKICGIKP